MLLEPYRVLDLTRGDGVLCGQILADLGADVIQVEPPGGAEGRSLGPFFKDRTDADSSLSWWGYSRGKRSIELDIDAARETFIELLKRTDFLVEAEPVGSLDARGLSPEALAAINPALIHISMTPFGTTGPKAAWQGTDLTLLASAGPLALTGDDDRPPVRVSVPQAWHHAAVEAVVGGLAALQERHRSGRGQQVMISAQQALTMATQGYILSEAVGADTAQRTAGGIKAGNINIRLTYPASDGFVSVTHLFGATIGPPTARLMDYVHEQGFCDEATRDKDWLAYGLLLAHGDEPISEWERVKGCVAACLATKTKEELLKVAMERRLLLAPMTTIADVVESEQFADRQYFSRPAGDSTASSIRYPGPFARFSETPLDLSRPPPALGEHTREVLEEINNTSPVSLTATGNDQDLPLAGITILDLMWALAGPGATRMLADLGATVIRVESTSKLDVCRTISPFIDGDEESENSAIFHSTNAGKKMITVDLTKEEGRDVIRDLVKQADVITESFSPRAMKMFGLEYERLKEINPDIIMLSTCLMGQTGPLAMFAGYGNLAAAIAGFYAITGWPDREPAGPFGAYTDYISPRYNAAAVLAALDYRRRTGKGQHIDLAQSEASLHFLTPAVLDYIANGHVQGRPGNRDTHMAPHGVYPTAGEDQHIAIACASDAHWQALISTIPTLANLDPAFNSAPGRITGQDQLDQLIGDYVNDRDAFELEAQLQAAGVPASVVQNSPELYRDPQLQHLGHFIHLPHPQRGQTTIEASRIHLSRSPTYVDSSAPTFARDMPDIIENVLGYTDEQFGQLLACGALE